MSSDMNVCVMLLVRYIFFCKKGKEGTASHPALWDKSDVRQGELLFGSTMN